MAAPCRKWVNNGKADQFSDDDLATKGAGNIPTVTLWDMESDSNSKRAFYFPNTEMPQQMYYKGIMMVTIYKCGGQNISPIPLQMKITQQDETRSNKKQSNPFN